jgi:hypothetical protein
VTDTRERVSRDRMQTSWSSARQEGITASGCRCNTPCATEAACNSLSCHHHQFIERQQPDRSTSNHRFRTFSMHHLFFPITLLPIICVSGYVFTDSYVTADLKSSLTCAHHLNNRGRAECKATHTLTHNPLPQSSDPSLNLYLYLCMHRREGLISNQCWKCSTCTYYSACCNARCSQPS